MGVVHAGHLCALYFNQGAILYPGAKNRVAIMAPAVPGAEWLKIATSAGSVAALYLPATVRSDDRPEPDFASDNGANLLSWR